MADDRYDEERRARDAERREREYLRNNPHVAASRGVNERGEPTGADADPRLSYLTNPGDLSFADDPFMGFVSGHSARRDAYMNALMDERARADWNVGLPDWLDLTPEYAQEGNADEYGNLLGGPSAHEQFNEGQGDMRTAMHALRSLYERGGYTDADKAQSQAMRAQQAQNLGASNQAALQNMQARGMGASGAELAMRMQGGEATNFANSQADAQIQQAAMQRALGALQGYGQMSTAYTGAEQARRNALDAFNQSNMDWRRGRQTRNTAWTNSQQDAQTRARETAARLRLDRAAGLTSQYGIASSGARQDQERMDETGRAQVAAVGSGISTLGGGGGFGGG